LALFLSSGSGTMKARRLARQSARDAPATKAARRNRNNRHFQIEQKS